VRFLWVFSRWSRNSSLGSKGVSFNLQGD